LRCDGGLSEVAWTQHAMYLQAKHVTVSAGKAGGRRSHAILRHRETPQIYNISARQRPRRARYSLCYRQSVSLSVRPSVRHTDLSVKTVEDHAISLHRTSSL